MDRRPSSSSSFLAILDEAQANTQRASAAVRDLNHATARDRERQAKQDRIRRQLEEEQKRRRKQAEKLARVISLVKSPSIIRFSHFPIGNIHKF
jgi:hypothetical protein